MTAYGIDVSSIQSATVDRDGIAFTVVKATEGRTYTNPDHASQVATARAAGHVVGHYHYLWPGNIDAQARYFVQQANPQPGDFLACDWETAGNGSYASSAEKDEFLRLVKQLAPDHRVVLYCNRDYWDNHDTSGNAGDGLWIADPDHPAGSPRVSAPWLIHQYGEDGGVDLDVFNGSAEDLRAWAGAAGGSAPAPAGGDTYTVVSGDTLSGIAAAHGVSLSALEAANPQISNPDLIHPGDRITIPGSSSAPAPDWPTYTVVSGDTLSGIAAAHGVSLSMLEDANPQISNPDLIYPGQVLQLPAASSAPAPERRTYTVVPGDNLSQIAAAHGVSLSALEDANPQISNPDLIYPGQEINLP